MAADVLDVIKPIGEPPITKFSIETYGSDDFALSVSWSPSGTSPSRGCLLSVLTNQGDVILYDYTTKSTPANWTRVVSCVKSLQGALNDDPEHVIPPDEIRDYVFNCMFSFAPLIHATLTQFSNVMVAQIPLEIARAK